MPRICTICTHAEREALDNALVAGSASNRALASQYGVSECAIRRHKAKHLPAALAEAQRAAEVTQAGDLLSQVRTLHARTLSLLDKAERAGQLSVALQGVREARSCLELLARVLGELDERPQVNLLLASPEWLTTRAAILRSLEPYPEARLAVVASMQEVGNAGP